MNNPIKSYVPFILLSFLTSCSMCNCKQNSVADSGPVNMTETVNKANQTALSFYEKEVAQKDKNAFFSPYSIRSAFAMVKEGAAGKTAAEIENAFSFDKESVAMRSNLNALNDTLEKSFKGTKFSQANSLWVQEDYDFLPKYISLIKKQYKSEVKNVDFKENADSAIKIINDWTAQKTNGKIKNLFAKNSIDSSTKMALVNAVYFKGAWQTAFDKESTFEADFTLNNGNKVKTELMRFGEDEKLFSGSDEDGQYLRLHYKSEIADDGAAMLILLPENSEKFAKVEKNLSKKIQEVRGILEQQKTKVFLPKFKLSSEYDLSESLKKMGVTEAFNSEADFSGMDGKKDLSIQTAVHKTFIEVNEEGSEAAAATGVTMGITAMPPSGGVQIFRADKPFIFVIETVKDGIIVFMGKVENPNKS